MWNAIENVRKRVSLPLKMLDSVVFLALCVQVVNDTRLALHDRVHIAFHTSMIVLLTLVLNGSTVAYVYRWLKIYEVTWLPAIRTRN